MIYLPYHAIEQKLITYAKHDTNYCHLVQRLIQKKIRLSKHPEIEINFVSARVAISLYISLISNIMVSGLSLNKYR